MKKNLTPQQRTDDAPLQSTGEQRVPSDQRNVMIYFDQRYPGEAPLLFAHIDSCTRVI